MSTTKRSTGFEVKPMQMLTDSRAEFPPDKVHTLESNDHVSVEADKEVKTQ